MFDCLVQFITHLIDKTYKNRYKLSGKSSEICSNKYPKVTMIYQGDMRSKLI